MASWAVHTLSAHPLTVAGWALVAVGLLAYLLAVLLSVRRVRGQYSSAMRGRGGMGRAAAFAAAGRWWPFLLVAIAGGVLVWLGR